VTAADFPFHQMVDPLEANYLEREVTFDTDDVMSSQGVFRRHLRRSAGAERDG